MVGGPPREPVPHSLAKWHWPLLLPAVGRRLRWRLARGPVSFTLQSLAVAPSLSGKLRSVQVTATDVDYESVRLDRVLVLARDVRVRPFSVSVGSVELRIQFGQQGLDHLLENGLPYAKLHLDGDIGRAELVAHPGWGSVELAPRVDDGGLVLEPVAITRQDKRWSAPARVLPRLRIGSEVLLPGSRLIAADVIDGRLHLTAELTDVTVPLLARADSSGVVDLTAGAPLGVEAF
jgi:hypothetical protein